MGFQEFIVLQFLAHVLADYFFQTCALAEQKNTLGFKSRFLIWHTGNVFLTSWLLSFQIEFFIGAGIIAISHYFIDGIKAIYNKKTVLKKSIFFIDQGLHILVLILVSWFYAEHHGLKFIIELPIDANTLAIITAYLFCLKPTNILIKEVFKSSEIDVAITNMDIDTSLDTNELPNAGKIIGILERLLTLTLILVGQYAAVGFLIAAKSILRYKDTDTLKTEYVLIGTMLSFGVAVLLGILTSFY